MDLKTRIGGFVLHPLYATSDLLNRVRSYIERNDMEWEQSCNQLIDEIQIHGSIRISQYDYLRVGEGIGSISLEIIAEQDNEMNWILGLEIFIESQEGRDRECFWCDLCGLMKKDVGLVEEFLSYRFEKTVADMDADGFFYDLLDENQVRSLSEEQAQGIAGQYW